jgi:hypothetical protein
MLLCTWNAEEPDRARFGFFATAAADIGDTDSGPLNQPQIVRER